MADPLTRLQVTPPLHSSPAAARPTAGDRTDAAVPATPPRPAAAAAGAERATPVVRVRGLRHIFADGTTVDYGDVPLEVRSGERVVLLGPNGSGKSTLLMHILGLIQAQAGEVTVFGKPAHALAPAERIRIAALLQQIDEQLIGPTVWDDVAFTPRNLGLHRETVDRLVEAALRRLDVLHLRHKIVHALSAGEKRKVALAGMLVFSTAETGPGLLVLDEPFAALDPRSRAGLLALIEELRRDHRTAVLLSTHFVHTVPEFADTVYVLAPGGRIAAHGTPQHVFNRPDVLDALDIEPPVLSQLFRSLAERGISLPPALTVEHAADLLARHCRPGGRRLPGQNRGR